MGIQSGGSGGEYLAGNRTDSIFDDINNQTASIGNGGGGVVLGNGTAYNHSNVMGDNISDAYDELNYYKIVSMVTLKFVASTLGTYPNSWDWGWKQYAMVTEIRVSVLLDPAQSDSDSKWNGVRVLMGLYFNEHS